VRLKEPRKMIDYGNAGKEVADVVVLAAQINRKDDPERVAAMTILSVAIMSVIERYFAAEVIPAVVDKLHESLHRAPRMHQKASTQPPGSVKH
jgi:hypothetical protein